ncbi:Disease resistance protein [Quillaja saponaria]|uniref:Disease resistance protein n=1 Tax=Quillaja saponaria TaxID=32244 RepID=A0AAD7PP26_QUISA|nr:Disease resistance protein [Quillaja saponaria]
MNYGPILEIFTRLWGCSANRIGYISNLEKNLTSLQTARDELKSLYQDVNTEVELVEEQIQLKRTNEVSNWLVQVEAKEKEVGLILHKGEQVTQSKCIWSCCPKNCWSSYKLGKGLPEMINEVKALVEKRHTFNIVGHKMPYAPFQELPMETTNVGLESSFDKVCKCFEDASVGIIGLYGMGGVGKTTLLKKFNNDFLATRHELDVVIWVVVSQEFDIVKIQQAIRNKLRIPDEDWVERNVDERAVAIFNVMKRKKFVLLLDDMWKRFDLLKLGVPNPGGQNGSKVIFTTRSEEISSNMGAHRSIRVECLAPERALNLFQKKVGEETLNSHPSIPHLAKEMVAECQGLPLALITIGRAMANKKDPNQWKHSIQILKNNPSKISGEDIINCLKLACLLERGEQGDGVKMHDVVRDMALWVACEHGSKPKFGAFDGTVLISNHNIDHLAKWRKAERLSLWRSTHLISLGVPASPNLLTMIVGETTLTKFPNGYFKSGKAIKVLDLSHNSNLVEIPAEIGELANLQYLNLSYTSIKMLPIELKKLRTLRTLLLNYTDCLTIPRTLMSSLLSLQVFSKLMIVDEDFHSPFYDESLLLQELESLEHLKDITIVIFSFSSVEMLLNSTKLLKSIKYLILSFPLGSQLSLNKFKLTEHQYICNLQTLEVTTCGITNLSWLPSAPNLQSLKINGCGLLESIISEDLGAAGIETFGSLETLELSYLPRLGAYVSKY